MLLSVFYAFFILSEYVFGEGSSVLIFPIVLMAPFFGLWQLVFGFTQHIRFRHKVTGVYLWVSLIYLAVFGYFLTFQLASSFLWTVMATIPICLNWLLVYYFYQILPYLDPPKDDRFDDILDA
ncbi:MAG: hypothetical protein AAFY36_00380 [Bacteroidota bacterium]